MNIENCERCGTIFQKTFKDICPKCITKEEEDYKKVRLYLKRHKVVEMAVVSKETEVDLELIHQFLQDGRIVLDQSSSTSYPCKVCSSPIQTGACCSNCLNELNDVQQALQMSIDLSQEADANKKGAFHARS